MAIFFSYFKWDPDVDYQNSVRIVDGGYENFMIMYPMKTSNPNFRRKTQFISYDDLNEIEYPNLSEIKMKDDPKNIGYSSFKRPSIDRTSKLAAVNTYNFKKPLTSIIQEQEQLIDQALEHEKEVLRTETDLSAIMMEQDVGTDVSMLRQQELSNTLLQYDHLLDDNVKTKLTIFIQKLLMIL